MDGSRGGYKSEGNFYVAVLLCKETMEAVTVSDIVYDVEKDIELLSKKYNIK